jgi:hypothetical protein
MESDTRTEVKSVDAAVIGNILTLCKRWLNCTGFVDTRQPLKHVGVDNFVNRRSGTGSGIKVWRLKSYTNDQTVFRANCRRTHRHRSQQAQAQDQTRDTRRHRS